MSEVLLNSVQEMIKKETWTRATISNYTKNNLIELASFVEKANELSCMAELKAVSDEQLLHTNDSIAALYISGMAALRLGSLDNSHLVSLVDIFKKNHKETLVVYICQSILDIEPANKFALRTLIGYYKADNDERLWATCEQLVKADFEEADVTKMLAEHYDQKGDAENAVLYYKKALLRYVSAKNISGIKEVWTKLIAVIPEEIDFFLMVQRKIAKSISDIKSILLMQELYQYYKDTKKWDTAIDILKLILGIDAKDQWARREITECYRGKYENHSHLEECIRSSNLSASYRNVFEAINDFEKHIAFDKGHFVFHRTWGVGKIESVSSDSIKIKFGRKIDTKEMSLEIAVSALQPLDRQHIWVLKATAKNREELTNKVKNDPNWALKTIIRSFGNSCDFKQIKAELVPSILDERSWTNWNAKAKKEIEKDASFGVDPNNSSAYIVRDHEISREEKLSNEFKAQKQFFARIDILMRFIADEETDKESELFADMFTYFTGYLKSFSTVNEQIVASYLVANHVGKVIPALYSQPRYTFSQIFAEIDNPARMYESLKDTKNTHLRDDYLAAIKLLPGWADIYIRLFPTALKQEMIADLIAGGHTDKVQELAASCFENYREYRNAVIYFFDKCQNEQWFRDAGIPYEKQLITLVNCISQCYKEINGHVDTTENKKTINAAEDLLFKKGTLVAYINDNDADAIKRIYTLVNDVKNLDGSEKAMLRREIQKKYPDFKFQETEEKAEAPRGLIVTKRKMDEKTAELDNLVNVEVPKNAKEIGEAAAKGDLKENSDFTAAKDYQRFLNGQIAKLQEELARAVVFDPTTVTTEYISFGTTATLYNNKTKKKDVYTIMGPWESNPAQGIISYMSPLGNALLNARRGEALNFKVNETEYSLTVESISIAEI